MPDLPFQVVPVLDLKNGIAVHAVAGRRAHYQPLQSILHPSSDPVELARAIRDKVGLRVLYLADLDAIAGQHPNLNVHRQIMSLGIHLMIDAGVRDIWSAAGLLDLDSSMCTIVAGLETLDSPSALELVINELGPGRVVFSLDLFEGRPVTAPGAQWSGDNPELLAHEAIERGAQRLLLLDMARVGTGRGVSIDSLMTRIRATHPAVKMIAGGGISRIDDVVVLKGAGASGVLVGSALHDGRIGARELDFLSPPSFHQLQCARFFRQS
jgi:phosphoribosylformimino-5-aminoimidazole carboxamide ribotide isomerase